MHFLKLQLTFSHLCCLPFTSCCQQSSGVLVVEKIRYFHGFQCRVCCVSHCWHFPSFALRLLVLWCKYIIEAWELVLHADKLSSVPNSLQQREQSRGQTKKRGKSFIFIFAGQAMLVQQKPQWLKQCIALRYCCKNKVLRRCKLRGCEPVACWRTVCDMSC